MPESFLFYKDYWLAAESLPEEKQLPFIRSVVQYGIYDVPFPETNDPAVKMAFLFIKTLLDTNKRNRINGAKGGRAKKANNPGKTPLKPNDNVNDNANDNENGNVNANSNDNENLKVSRPTSDSPLSEDGLTDEDRAAGWMYMR